MDHKEIMTLIVGYTCVGVFVATAIITILSLVGLLRIDPDAKKKLFSILVVEVVLIGVALWRDFITIDKNPLEAKIETLVAETTRSEELVEARRASPGDLSIKMYDYNKDSRALPGDSGIKPRVYFHIKNETQRPSALQSAKALSKGSSVIVPGIQRLDVGPSSTELRYFKKSDEAEAIRIGQDLRAVGIEAHIRYVPGFENSKGIRPRHYELWISG